MRPLLLACLLCAAFTLPLFSRDLSSGKYELIIKIKDNESKFPGYLLVAKQSIVFSSIGIEGNPMVLEGRISKSGAVTLWDHHIPKSDDDTPHSHHFHGEIAKEGVINGEGIVINLLTPHKFGWSLVPAKP